MSPQQSVGVAIAELRGELREFRAEVQGAINVLNQAVGAGDKEGQQSLAAVAYRVGVLEERMGKAEQAEKDAKKERDAFRRLAISAVVLTPVGAVITAVLTRALG